MCRCVTAYGYCFAYSRCYPCPPTTPPKSGGGGGTQPTNTPGYQVASPTKTPIPAPPRTSIIPNTTLNPYETACGTGKCTNGYYCCNDLDGSDICCRVGDPPPGGGGGSTTLLGIRLLNPSLSPVSFPSVSLCKVNCKDSPCYALNCQKEVSSADFSGQIKSKHGGAIRDPNKNLTILGITPIQNNEIFTGLHSFNCRSASITDIKDCYYWTSALQTGSRILYYIVTADIPTISLTPSPTPTPSENLVKLKDTSFYTPRLLAQNIPSSPLPFDSDDDAAPYFITSSPGSDPGLVSADYIHLGAGLPSFKDWKTIDAQSSFLFNWIFWGGRVGAFVKHPPCLHQRRRHR